MEEYYFFSKAITEYVNEDQYRNEVYNCLTKQLMGLQLFENYVTFPTIEIC